MAKTKKIAKKAAESAAPVPQTYKIKQGLTGEVLFSASANSFACALEAAVKASTVLRGAYLRGAYLRGAYLQGADLQGADLRGAYLRGADIQGAYLRGAYGLIAQLVTPLLMLLDQPGAIRAYKLVTAEGDSPINDSKIRYEIGNRIEVLDACTDVNKVCAAGISVAPLDWCLLEWMPGWRVLLVEFVVADIAAIPTGTDGKFRLHRCTIISEVDLAALPWPSPKIAASATELDGSTS